MGYGDNSIQLSGNNGQVIEEVQFTATQVTPSSPLVKQASLAVGSCTLNQLVGFQTNAALRYVQLHDVGGVTVGAGTVPLITLPVPGASTLFSFAFTWKFQKGLVIALSSTAFTFTADGSAELWYMVDLIRGI